MPLLYWSTIEVGGCKRHTIFQIVESRGLCLLHNLILLGAAGVRRESAADIYWCPRAKRPFSIKQRTYLGKVISTDVEAGLNVL